MEVLIKRSKKDDRITVMERDDSHHKMIVLLKRNVNFLLTGTVHHARQGRWKHLALARQNLYIYAEVAKQSIIRVKC